MGKLIIILCTFFSVFAQAAYVDSINVKNFPDIFKVNIFDTGANIGHSSKNALVGGMYVLSEPVLTDGDQSELLVNENGHLKVNLPTVTVRHLSRLETSPEEEHFLKVGGIDNVNNRFEVLGFENGRLKVTDPDTANNTATSASWLNGIYNKLSFLGSAEWFNSSPVVLSNNFHSSFNYVTPAIGKELLTGGTSSTSWYDAKTYNSLVVSYKSTTAVGQFIFEGTNDPADTTGSALMWVSISSNGNETTSAISFGTTIATVSLKLKTRYVRMRTTVAATGTVSIFPYFKQLDSANNNVYISGGTFPPITFASPATTDIGNATITTSPSNLNATLGNTNSFSFVYNVTAISGSGAYVDLEIWESLEGTNYKPIYQFPRITATGSYPSPTLKLTGGFIQYRRTVGGTSPSITQSGTRNNRQVEGKIIRNFYDRTLTGNVLANGTIYELEGTKTVTFTQSSAAGASVAPVFTVEGSDNGVNFVNLGTLTATASTNTSLTVNVLYKFYRFRCSTAGTSAVINYLNIRGQE